MSTGMIVLDEKFLIKGVDNQIVELFGYDLEECYGQKLSLFTPEFNEQKYFSEHENIDKVPIILHGKTKNDFTVTLKCFFHSISQLNSTNYIVSMKEISGLSSELRHENLAQRSEGNRWLNYLLGSSPVVIYSCIPSGNFPTTFISENIVTLTGYSPNQYLSEHSFWIDHIHPDDKTRLLAEMTAIFSSEENHSHSFEYRFLCADGHYIWVLDKLKVSYDTFGCPTEMVGLWLDISKRKQDEQALSSSNILLKQKTDALTESNLELSQFTYVVSHDLKAPLRAIHSYCEWLSDDLDGKLEDDQQEYITGMQDAVQQAESLIEDLLELSRVGRHEAQVEKLALSDFLNDLTSSLVTDDVEFTVSDNMPSINASPTILTQVFQNLITNAYTYNQLPNKQIKILGYEENCHYIVSVTDNGIGIDPTFHERIFQLFQRLHTKEEYDGTGIGLAIVHKAVTHLNWHIHLHSALNQGSTFFVSIPLKDILNE